MLLELKDAHLSLPQNRGMQKSWQSLNQYSRIALVSPVRAGSIPKVHCLLKMLFLPGQDSAERIVLLHDLVPMLPGKSTEKEPKYKALVIV